MSDPYLTIVSQGGTIQSNEIASTGVGVEVRAGVTGLGLPPVDLQFDESAGDGSRYRGRRVKQRSLDLHFQIYGPDRDSLKPDLDRVSQVLAYPCTVTLVDEDAGESWQIVGYRSGGGDYAYGDLGDSDATDGSTVVIMSVTLVTETPYWESTTPIVLPMTAGAVMVNNPGTVASPPVWTVTGPTLGFKVESEDGDTLWFSSLIDSGTTVTLDCGAGTVTDNNGRNRYNDLTDLPRFWNIPEGSSVVNVSYDRSSTDYETVYGEPRHNFVTNPRFENNATGWTLTGFSYEAANKRLIQSGGLITAVPKISTVCTGLEVGENYVVRMDGSATRDIPWPNGASPTFTQIVVNDGGVRKVKVIGPKAKFASSPFTFTAENATVTLEIYPLVAQRKDDQYARSSGWIDNVYLGEAGTYFDGSFPDAANMQYDWTGAAHASVSIATPLSIPKLTGGVSSPIVKLSYRPRKWLVI